MGLLAQAARLYPYVFHPSTVLGGCILLLVHHEWRRQGAAGSALWWRVAGFLAAGLLSFAPTAAYVLVTGTGPLEVTRGNVWQVDALVASGILVACGATWLLWRYFDWGDLVPGAMQAFALVTLPYAALSPVWNVSGHVMIALAPTLYLALVDRSFWPLLAVPVVMVPNRVYLGAHTVAQSVGAFLLAAAVVLGVYWLQTGGTLQPEPDSTTLGRR